MNSRVADLPQLPFWNVNGLAAYILKTLSEFKDEFPAKPCSGRTRENVYAESTRKGSGLSVFSSKANFLYVELSPKLPRKLRDRLLEQFGLMVRECSNKIGSSERYLRLAVQTKEAVDLLVQALSRELSLSQWQINGTT